MERKNVLKALAVGGLMAGTLPNNTALAADQTILPVSACGGDDAVISWTTEGAAYNFRPTRTTFFCGVGQDHAVDTNDDIRIYFDDFTTTGAVNCGWASVDEDWSTAIIGTGKFGCATAGGCPGSTVSAWTGSNYITFSDVRHGGAYSTFIRCSLPQWGTVKSIVLDEQ